MEIERKYLITSLPKHYDTFPHDTLCQAYISTDPVIRIRQKNSCYILTVKSSGLLAREEYELPITENSFQNLMGKAEGNVIEKIRYRIPESDGLTIELDIFQGIFDGLKIAEIEFKDLKQANEYHPPVWFGPEVTEDSTFHNSNLSMLTSEEVLKFLEKIR